ncbi:glycerophosphodiester phosphodiesterase family protein [Paenibacillus sp. UMB4589-SE434]|uniref:glycerophosphodiester phosphodiesterase n=1 Tax=Paenibacillus sp. UMB4589-SE434 TaxID=3046314 RepID=UPI00254F27A9|nr:glycerophosphodiester phosphodiesterase family protein [Paenibacillus sp. UMB4589-SE434]MDK8182946.1 glycerophosphodiester phosphodiesterase family protein [Paenibacillus sp. UMB4589-SE434]
MKGQLDKTSLEIVAHRGYAAIFPENTMEAFRRSLDLGADSIELDIHHTKESIPVIIHDDTLNRTTTGTGRIRDLTLADILEADAGIKFKSEFAGCKVPLLEEALELCSERKAGLQLELKEHITEEEGRALLQMLNIYNLIERTIIISFHSNNLMLVRKLHPTIELGFLTDNHVALEPLTGLGRAACCLQYELVLNKPELIREANELGLDLAVWTVRSLEIAKQLYALGIRRMTTDIPLLKSDIV